MMRYVGSFGRSHAKWLSVVVAVAMFSGCGDDEVAAPESEETILLTDEATEEQCEYGGTVIIFGKDTSGDGEIDEAGDETVICNGEPGLQGPDGDEGPRGPTGDDGERGPAGADADCAGVEPLSIEASIEEAVHFRVDRSYELTVETGTEEDVKIDVLGGFVVGEMEGSEGVYSAEISFKEAKTTQVLVVATDGCHLDTASLELEVAPPPFVKLAASVFYTCGLRADGTITCWGIQQDPGIVALGDESDEIDAGPLARSPEGNTFVDVQAGFGTACGLHANGAATCWSALVDGVPLPTLPVDSYQKVFPGGAPCGLTSEDTLFCRDGDDSDYFVASEVFPDKTAPEFVNVGQYIPGFFGFTRYLAVLNTGEAYKVQLFNEQDEPEPILEGSIFSDTDIDTVGFCGIDDDEFLRCAFADTDGDEEVVSENSGAIAVSVGYSHGCAVFDDGSVECIGEVYHGDLFGDWVADPDDLAETVFDVPDQQNFVDIATGVLHACGLTDDESVICWGSVEIDGVEFPEVTDAPQ